MTTERSPELGGDFPQGNEPKASPARDEGERTLSRSAKEARALNAAYEQGRADGQKALSPAQTGGTAVAWRRPDEVPEAKPGDYAYRIVAVKRAHNSETYSFGAYYLNAVPLWFEDDNEARAVTGWNTDSDDDDGPRYEPLLCPGDQLMGWCEFPLYAGPVAEGAREALREALAAVEYQPGDHPVVPIKHDAFVKAVRAILQPLDTGTNRGGG